MIVIRTAALCGLLGLVAPFAQATQNTQPPELAVFATQVDDQAAATQQAALDTQYTALKENYETALYAWYDELDAVQKKNEDGAGLPYPASPDGDFFPQFWKIAEAGQLDSRLWCLSNFEFSELPKERRLVAKLRLYLDTIDTGHKTHAKEILGALSGEMDEWDESALGRALAFALMDELGVVSGTADVQGRAIFSKANALAWSDNPADHDLALEQFELLVERFPEHSLAPRAQGVIFAAENLQIDYDIPELAGVDVDGNSLKLSDHEGKVAVITFWGFW